MVESKPHTINDDADELSYRLSIRSTISEYITPYFPIVDQLQSIEYRLEEISEGHIKSEEEELLLVIKDELLFRLLEERVDMPESSVHVKMIKYPDEEIHPFSRNMLIIEADDQNGNSQQFVSYVNLLARARGQKDARKVLQTIGDPDEIQPSRFHQYLTRTFKESRRANEILNDPEGTHDDELIKAAANTYYSVLPARVKEVCELDEFSIEFNTEDAEFLFTNYKGNVAYSRYFQNDIADVIKMSGIPVTKVENTEELLYC